MNTALMCEKHPSRRCHVSTVVCHRGPNHVSACTESIPLACVYIRLELGADT